MAGALSAYSINAQANNYEKALQAYQSDNIEVAYIHLKNALRDNPKSLSAKLLFADVLLAKDLYQEAEQTLNSALALGADINLIVEPMCTSLLKQGQFGRVLTAFDESRLTPASTLQYHKAKASAYMGLNDHAQALSAYQTLLAQYPDDIDVRMGLLSVLIAQGDFQQAQTVLSVVSHLADSNSMVLRYMAVLASESGEHKLALDYYQKAYALEPKNPLTLRGLANSYIAVLDFEAAKDTVNELVTLTPYDPQALLLQSLVLRNLKDAKGSNQLLNQITDQLSTLDQTFLLSKPQLILIDAMASYGQEDWEQARRKFITYLKQAEDELDIRAVVLLADTYKQLEYSQKELEVLAQYETQLLAHKDYALLLAGSYIKYNKKFDADNLLSQLRGLYGDDAGILLMSAHLENSRGQASKAIATLQSAQLPENESYQHTLASLYLNTGQFTESLKLSEQLTDAHPENIDYQLLQVRALISLKRTDEASTKIRELYHEHGRSDEVKFEYAKLLFNEGDSAKAHAELTRLTRDFPNKKQYVLALAEVEYARNQFDNAKELLVPLTNTGSVQQQALYKLAIIELEQQNFAESLKHINRLLRIDRLNESALFAKARALHGLNDTESAQSQCHKLYSLWSDNQTNLVKLSKLQFQLGLLADARKSLEQAHSLNNKNQQVLIGLVKIDVKQQQLTQAQQRVTQANDNKYVDPITYEILLGNIAIAGGDAQGAFDHYAQVFTIDNGNSLAFMSLYQLARLDAVKVQFTKLATELVRQLPNKALFRSKLADHLMWSGDWQAAKHQYQILLTKPLPKHETALALNNLAVIHTKDGQIKQAVQLSQQAIAILPDSPALLDTAGWALVKAGKESDGLPHLRQAYSMNASDPEVLYHLTFTLAKLGKSTEAKAMYTKLLAADSLGRFKAQANELSKNLIK